MVMDIKIIKIQPKTTQISNNKAHSNNLIAMSKHTNNTFFTSSQDATLRLWDLRSQSSIKLIRSKALNSKISNPASNSEHQVFIGCEKNIYQFDIRKQDIFIESICKQTEQPHYDDISQIRYDSKFNQILCCDDEGDIRVYSDENQESKYLKCISRLQQEHINICNCVEPLFIQNKQYKDKRICISGGFDSTLILWDMQQEKPLKKIPVIDIMHKFGITTNLQEHPFIHSIEQYGASVLVGVESGYVLCLPILDLKKPKFIMQCSLTRVTDCSMFNLMGKNTMIVTAIDNSFSLFDIEQRINGEPKFLCKYKTIQEPTQVEVMDNYIMIVSESPALSFYEIKG